MNPDIIAAIATYLQGVMGQSLASGTGYPQVYGDYAPGQNPDDSPVSYPYAVVTDGPESYTDGTQSQDPASGYRIDTIATGTAQIGFYDETKAGVRALVRAAVRLVTDTQVALQASDGRVITIFPLQSVTVPLEQPGIGEPGKFLRVLTVQYRQQFPE